jgi:Helix-turn-helix domain
MVQNLTQLFEPMSISHLACIANSVIEKQMPNFPAEQIAIGQFRTGLRHDLDPIIMVREAARVCGLHAETLKNEARRGKLKLLRVSQRKIGVRKSELDRYLESCAYAGANVVG